MKKLLNEKINLGQKDIIHFVGIGGIGMSGLAQIMKIWVLEFKEVIKIKIKIQLVVQNQVLKYLLVILLQNIKKATILVKSSAIKNNNTEIRYAKKKDTYLFKS